MKHDPKYRTLTPLRAVDLLTTLTDQGDTEWKLRQAKDALRDHIRAALVKSRRRRK